MPDLFRPNAKHQAIAKEAEERKLQLEREQLAITRMMDMPGGKILHARVLEKGDRKKRDLFKTELDCREHTAGKLTGWIECLEWVILQLSPLKSKEDKQS